jgi:predicted metal-dependent hydrolase
MRKVYLKNCHATMPQMSSVRGAQDVIHRTNPRSRSVRVTVSHTGQVIVTRPPRFPQWRAEQFLAQSKDWIEKQQLKIYRQKAVLGADPNHKVVLYRGVPYSVEIGSGMCAVEMRGGKLHVSPVENTAASISRALERWMRAESEQLFIKTIHELAESMRVSFSAVVFKSQSTRWGSCSSAGNINLHWRLIQAPDAVANYVIIHELAHRREMNHGPRFWKLVGQHDPEYRSHRAWLTKHGMLLQSPLWE